MDERGAHVKTAIKLAGFVFGITMVFFATYAIGTAVGPLGMESAERPGSVAEQPVSHEHAQVMPHE